MVMRVLILLTALLAAVQARAYYDAIVVDAESRTDDGERPSLRRATFEDCLQPKQSGHCRAFFQSYFYNKLTKRCELFVYTGCGGNNNRFETLEECEKVCAVKRKEDLTETGNKKCGRNAPRPFCNKGCRITFDDNNCPKCFCPKGKYHHYFKVQSTGMNQGKHAEINLRRRYVPSDSVCSLPAVRGHCRALLPRWRYDPEAGKCTEFKFGGCDGNGNNFRTEEQCMRTCGGFGVST